MAYSQPGDVNRPSTWFSMSDGVAGVAICCRRACQKGAGSAAAAAGGWAGRVKAGAMAVVPEPTRTCCDDDPQALRESRNGAGWKWRIPYQDSPSEGVACGSKLNVQMSSVGSSN